MQAEKSMSGASSISQVFPTLNSSKSAQEQKRGMSHLISERVLEPPRVDWGRDEDKWLLCYRMDIEYLC